MSCVRFSRFRARYFNIFLKEGREAAFSQWWLGWVRTIECIHQPSSANPKPSQGEKCLQNRAGQYQRAPWNKIVFGALTFFRWRYRGFIPWKFFAGRSSLGHFKLYVVGCYWEYHHPPILFRRRKEKAIKTKRELIPFRAAWDRLNHWPTTN